MNRFSAMICSLVIASMVVSAIFAVSTVSGASITDSINLLNLFENADASSPVHHKIEMTAVKLDGGFYAYQMVRHIIIDGPSSKDVTSRYSLEPSIPGPTIVINEGDAVSLNLTNSIGEGMVSVHVHGVHYDITSDGTRKETNGISDQGAIPTTPYTYEWIAAKGTAGTWPYHDHTFGDMNGAEDRGLYGALIVNPKTVKAFVDGSTKTISVKDIKKEFVLYMVEDTFWGMEINNAKDGKELPLWTNPTLVAKEDDYVRYHIIGLGDQFHSFHLHGHRWLDSGTAKIIDTKEIAPLENHVFVVKAGDGGGTGDWQYHCHVFMHMQAGMMGTFRVSEHEGPSIPGYSPI